MCKNKQIKFLSEVKKYWIDLDDCVNFDADEIGTAVSIISIFPLPPASLGLSKLESIPAQSLNCPSMTIPCTASPLSHR